MIREGDKIVRSGSFDGWRPILYGTGLDGATVAVVGMGQVGRAIVKRLGGFGCRILGVDPNAELPSGVIRSELNPSLQESDFIILAAPLTAATRHLIGKDAITRMRPGALLINVGRGSVVDELAVAAALENGALGGYAADVFEMEDWALPDRPSLSIRDCWRILVRYSRHISAPLSRTCDVRSNCVRSTILPMRWPADGRAMRSTIRL